MYYLIFVGLAAVLVYQAWVSSQVMAAVEYERAQKQLQLAMIWLLPVVGAILVYVFLRSSREPLPAGSGSMEKPDADSDADVTDVLDMLDRR